MTRIRAPARNFFFCSRVGSACIYRDAESHIVCVFAFFYRFARRSKGRFVCDGGKIRGGGGNGSKGEYFVSLGDVWSKGWTK